MIGISDFGFRGSTEFILSSVEGLTTIGHTERSRSANSKSQISDSGEHNL